MLYNFDAFDIEQQFLLFLRNNNIEPIDNISFISDGELHRYRLNGDSKSETSGAYILHCDGLPSGFAQDWRSGTKLNWSYDTTSLSEEQRSYFNSDEFKKLQEKKREQQEKERNERYDKAAKDAEATWNRMLPAQPDHPYLVRKNINNYGLHYNRHNYNCLAIPLRDIHGNFRSIQWIPTEEKYHKTFFEGSSLNGAFWSIALDTINTDYNGAILLGEGYATMAKVYELTSLPAVAAMSCYSLLFIARIIHEHYSKAKIIITADNDKKNEINRGFNPGIREAQHAVNLHYAHSFIAPEFNSPDEGTDWDDFALKFGDDYTEKILREKISWELLTEAQKKELKTRQILASAIHVLDPSVKLPPQEFIGGIFPRRFVTALVAPPGTGKTVFMQKFCSDISTGGSVFDGFAEDEPERKCLILAGEAGFELLARRAASMKWPVKSENVNIVDQYEFETKDIPIMLDSPEGWDNLIRLIDICKPDILFIDTFSSFHERDENKANEMKPLIKKLAKLARDFNIAVVLVHHSRKRAAKERNLSLNQDDVIGSSIINRLVGLIIGIEPMKDDEKVLLVRTLKSWFSSFMPFTYTMKENLYGGTSIKTDLAPASVNNSKIAVWNYLYLNFSAGEWFSSSQIILSEIECNIDEWQLRRILRDFVKNGKLLRRGSKKYLEYSLTKS